jgi:hypothetical protein
LRDDHGQIVLPAWATLEQSEEEGAGPCKLHSDKSVIVWSDFLVLVKELNLPMRSRSTSSGIVLDLKRTSSSLGCGVGQPK